jgi:pyridoxamine 5'-phosphate oxidase
VETELRRDDLAAEPLEQFRRWYAEAAAMLEVPEAMALATAAPDGSPSLRMVLLKRFDERGLVFHTHYTSRKGRQLEANPRAALLFHWPPLGRQVRVE